MKSRLALFVMGLSVILPGAARAGDALTEALSSVPEEAMGFICIPNLKQLDSDYQQAIRDLGLQPFVAPPMNSLVGLLKAKLPMLQGLDENGAMAVVLMPAENLMELQMKQALLIPAEDPKGMIETMGGQAGEGGLWTINMMGQPAHAAVRDKHVIVAASGDAAKALKESKSGINGKLKATDLKALKGLDLAVWLDADRFFKLVKPMLDGILGPAMMMQASAGGFEAKSAEMNKAQMDMFFEGAASVSFGVALDGSGLGLRGALTSKPGSELGKQLKMKNTSASLLRGLPENKYMLAFGQNMDPAQTTASLKNLDPLFSMGEEVEAIDAEKMKQLRGVVEEMLPMITGSRGAVIALDPGPGGLFGFSVVVDTTNGKKWLDNMAKIVDIGEQMLADAAKDETADEELKEGLRTFMDALSFDVQAEELNGTKVGHLKIDLTKVEDIDEDDREEVIKLIGQDGVLVRMAPVDDKTVVIAFGGGKARMEILINQAKKKDAPLDADAGVKKVADHLPKERASVAYVAVDQVLKCIQNVMTVLEEEALPVQMPPLDAPIALSSSGGDGWGQFDLFLPTELLVASKNAAMMMMGSMMAPPGGGPASTTNP